MLIRAACALALPGPVNTPQEAMYWTASVDGANHTLSGERNYILHFPAGGLPPNHAFWSLTMGDAKNRFVANPLNRYSVSDRSGLVPNMDGSFDIYLQNTVPADHAFQLVACASRRIYPLVAWIYARCVDSRRKIHRSARSGGEMMEQMRYEHLLIFISFMAITWFIVIYFMPRLLLTVFKRAILEKGFGDGPITINTIYTQSQASYADPLKVSGPRLMTTGVNRDTIIALGWLDLGKGPKILYVPDMTGRYYSVQLTDPSKNTNFSYVGKRTTGTECCGRRCLTET